MRKKIKEDRPKRISVRRGIRELRSSNLPTDNPLLDLFEDGGAPPDTLTLGQITQLDELLCMREASGDPEYFDIPAPGSVLSLYRGLSVPVLDPQCVCFTSAANDIEQASTDEDRDDGSDPD